MVSWGYPCFTVDGWYLSLVSPKRYCCRISAADKGWWAYLLDPCPDAVALYYGCTPDKRPHSTDSKFCPKWRIEKQAREIKTNKNISYPDAQKLIFPQISQTYAQVAKTSTATTTQTDETITKIVCPPLKLLQTLISIPKPTISSSFPAVTKSSTSTQAQLLPSISSDTVTLSSESQPPSPLTDTTPAISNSLFISAASSSSTACPVLETTTTTSNTIPATSQDAKQTSKPCRDKPSP
ncbi:uncharacterized protein TNCV_3982641 [Trichonephila clavipes]|nr:uncharacterized protein TNCV_3982641 [Trichonephila clavipes]